MDLNKLLVTLSTATILSGCLALPLQKELKYHDFSLSKPLDEGKSLALNIVEAANVDPKQEFYYDLKISSEEFTNKGGKDAPTPGLLSYQGFTGTLPHQPGANPNLVGSFFAVSSILLLLDTGPFEFKPRWIAWAPAGFDLTTLSKIIIDAHTAALPSGYTITSRTHHWRGGWTGELLSESIWYISGPGCPLPSAADLANIEVFISDAEDNAGGACELKTQIEQESGYSVKAPSWLGGYDAVAFGITSPDGRYSPMLSLIPDKFSTLEKQEFKDFDRREYLREVTKSLPKWIYYVEGPQSKKEGSPIMFNQGKAFFFVMKGV